MGFRDLQRHFRAAHPEAQAAVAASRGRIAFPVLAGLLLLFWVSALLWPIDSWRERLAVVGSFYLWVFLSYVGIRTARAARWKVLLREIAGCPVCDVRERRTELQQHSRDYHPAEVRRVRQLQTTSKSIVLVALALVLVEPFLVVFGLLAADKALSLVILGAILYAATGVALFSYVLFLEPRYLARSRVRWRQTHGHAP